MATEKVVALPEAIFNKPRLNQTSVIYWEGFYKLSQCRQFSSNGAPQPIVLSEIRGYARDLVFSDIELFIDIMLELDTAYFELKSKKVTKEK